MFKLATSIFAAMLLFCAQAQAFPKQTSSIAIDINTGEIISSESPDIVMHPASLTKLMTLYLTFEAIEKGKLKMSTPLKVSRYAASRSPSKLDVRPGETITVENAVKAVIVKSANDCATVLAEAL
ncbi:MAG: D-alanyl-D-alanine carboxypeptidase, partial [Alphaproteobacteria bacterium]|nr:D-alanyl-D-alanine carboxypeptidase [Alphaproteobacteria bacterium]